LDDTVSVPAERVDLRVAEQVALIGHRRPLRSGSVLWAPGTSELDRAAGCRVLFFSVPPSLRGFVHSGHFTPPPTHPPPARGAARLRRGLTEYMLSVPLIIVFY
jgi:hypothetical protein